MWSDAKALRAYERELPGGGFVAIDVVPVRSIFRGRYFEGSVIVERRASWRQGDHVPPTIARASGKNVQAVVHQLLPAAQHNPAIGLALLRWKRVAS